MKYKAWKKWNALIFIVIITTIIWWLIWSISIYTYSIFYNIDDLRSQVYLSIKSKWIKEREILDFTTNPINYSSDNFLKYENLSVNNFSQFKKQITQETKPWITSEFILADSDLETQKAINKIKKIVIYYNKTWEPTDSSLKLNMIRYNKLYNTDLQSGITYLNFNWCEVNADTSLPEYACQYELKDFNQDFKWNIYNYLMFISSDNWLSYTLKWRDELNSEVSMPSRYLEYDLDIASKWWNVKLHNNAKVDLYQKFNLNINKSLYNID